jgi:hypothetical protein
MDQQQFVDALKAYAADAAAEDTLGQWKSPSGRFQSQERLDRAAWLNGLSEQDRRMVQELASDTARATLFGVLCILDGSRRIEECEGAHLELFRMEGGHSMLLASSDFEAPPLHELL